MTGAGLLLSCSAGGERQFAGIRRLMAGIAAECWDAVYLEWRGQALDLRAGVALAVVSGHGLREEAGFLGPPAAQPLSPAGLRLASGASLYLLGCYQGGKDRKKAWAKGTGIAEERVHGCEGETESAFSTCLLLHLQEQGWPALERWFPPWQRCNADLEAHFPALRATYEECAGDPLKTWQAIRCLPALQPHLDFLGIAARHPEHLTGLR
jgi:hypothetical protein